MSTYKYCDCGNQFDAYRDSAKYCSVACSQRAYRKRFSIKKQQEADHAAQKGMIEKQHSRLEQEKAENERLLAYQQAYWDIINI